MGACLVCKGSHAAGEPCPGGEDLPPPPSSPSAPATPETTPPASPDPSPAPPTP